MTERQNAQNMANSVKFGRQVQGDAVGYLIVLGFSSLFRLVADIYRSLTNKQRITSSTPQPLSPPQQETVGANGWTKSDYDSYASYLQAHVTLMSEMAEAESKREAERNSARLANLEELLKTAKAHGNVSSISIDENGNHTIIFAQEPE